jgi:mRNA interferase MazF
VVVSPDELNEHLHTLIIAPLTTGGHSYPFRVPCRFHGKTGYVVVDQIRTVDQERLLRRLGQLAPATLARTLSVLQEMFAP